jgi:hypothetical protein
MSGQPDFVEWSDPTRCATNRGRRAWTTSVLSEFPALRRRVSETRWFYGRSGEGWIDEDRFAVKLADLFHQSI